MRLSPSESASFRFVPLHEAVARQQPVASAGGAADPGRLGCHALGLRAATDKVVLQAARNDHRVLVSAHWLRGAARRLRRSARRPRPRASWTRR